MSMIQYRFSFQSLLYRSSASIKTPWMKTNNNISLLFPIMSDPLSSVVESGGDNGID